MIHYHTTTMIHLSLEDFYNDGMTKEEAKEIIESIQDPSTTTGWGFKLICHPQYINGNWNVETWATHPEGIQHVVDLIEFDLKMKIKERA